MTEAEAELEAELEATAEPGPRVQLGLLDAATSSWAPGPGKRQLKAGREAVLGLNKTLLLLTPWREGRHNATYIGSAPLNKHSHRTAEYS